MIKRRCHRHDVRVVILVVLLICLCFSRGEGVHLLPFSEQSSGCEDTLNKAPAEQTKYQFSTFPVKAFDKNQKSPSTKVPTNQIASTADLGSAFAEGWATRAGQPVTGSFAHQSFSKFQLTSSSDRSPPLIFPI